MPIHEETADAERKVKKDVLHFTHGDKGHSPDIANVKESITDAARIMKEVSSDRAHAASDYVRDRMEDITVSGTGALKKAEARIRAKPGQSVAIAFTAGLLARYLLGRRSS